MERYTEERLVDDTWVKAEPMKASYENNFLYLLIKKIKECLKCI